MIENKTKKVSIVIPAYSTRDLLLKNLPNVLAAAQNPANSIQEVIVVDDGSVDDSVDVLRKNFPEVRTIKHKINRGFSAAVNTGVRMAKGKFVVLLNSDIYPQGDFLEKVLPFIEEDPDIFGVSFHERGWGWSRAGLVEGYVTHLPGKEDTSPHPTFYVNAGGAIYRRDIWMKIGGMDESIFPPFYWEDVDISYRALKRGYKLFWHPDAYVSPNISATVGKISKKRVSRIQERNHLLFVWKDVTSPRLLRRHVLGVAKRAIQHPGYFLIIFLALKKIPAVIKARKKEKRESKISDEAILARFK